MAYPSNSFDPLDYFDMVSTEIPIPDTGIVSLSGGSLPSSNSEEYTTSTLARAIRQSELYKQAYEIFSKDPRYGPQFIEQLEMIPSSVTIADKNFWDETSEFFGATSKYEEAFTDAFNTAMDEIRNLVVSYQNFINSLPSTQVEQLADAGINASVTGQGVNSSVLDTSSAVQPNASASAYSNDALGAGISSFVEFISSIASVASMGISSESILGMLSLAEREGYNKQEVHDMLLAGQGVRTSSPYRILNPSNTPVISDVSGDAAGRAKVSRAVTDSKVAALSDDIPVQFGERTEVMKGLDVLKYSSRFKLIDLFQKQASSSIRSQIDTQFAQLVGTLDYEYRMANLSALVAEGDFNTDYYSARSGASEGVSKTSVQKAISDISASETKLAAFNAWVTALKRQEILEWSKEVGNDPSVAPYFYKAILDFDMSDTFHYQDSLHQNVHHGLDVLQQSTEIIGNVVNWFKSGSKSSKASDFNNAIARRAFQLLMEQ